MLVKTPEKYFKGDPWTIVEQGFDPNRNRISESVFSVSNEYMGVRGYFEEGYSGDKLQGIYFNHLYEMLPVTHDQAFKGMVTETPSMINAVDWLYTRIVVDGETLDLAHAKFSEFVRRLHMKNSLLERAFVWETGSGKRLRLNFERFTDLSLLNRGCQRVSITPLNFSGTIEITSGLDFDTLYEIAAGWNQTQVGGTQQSGSAPRNFWQVLRKGDEDGVGGIMARTRTSGQCLFSGFRVDVDNPLSMKRTEHAMRIERQFTLLLEESTTRSFTKTVINHWSSVDKPDTVWTSGMKMAREHTTVSWETALRDHGNAWERAWYTMDTEIDGDPELQQGIRFCTFQTYSTYHGASPYRNALCKGLTGEVYFGWIFWDSEIYSHRFLMFNNPEGSKKLLQYRYIQMPRALQRARDIQCRGARFPFSNIHGYEASATWQHCDLEHHQNVAVAYAVWHYVNVCGDREYLYTEGIEMLVQICRFHASVGGWSPRNGDFGLYGVMGPDEFHMMVNHNCYTNWMVKKFFLYALEVLDEMKRDAPREYRQLVDTVELSTEETASWRTMAEKMRIPCDEKSGVYEQHDGYFDLPHVDLKKLSVDDIPIYKNWAYIRIFRHNMIKQPDLLNLMYFFGHEFSREQKKANYEFYEPRTVHESSLSPSLHAILAIELGKMDDAYDFLRYAARLDLDNYNRNTEQGIHATASSGVWAIMVYGYGGMRSDEDMLSFYPRIPHQWNSYHFRVVYRGSTIDVVVEKETARFTVLNDKPVTVGIYGEDHRITPEGIQVKLRQDTA